MISIFDLFSIGLGPSSSHTVGPMQAANEFVHLIDDNLLTQLAHVTVEIHGSLAYTGTGHGTNKAIFAGLEAYHPETADPDIIEERLEHITNNKTLHLRQSKNIPFNPKLHYIINIHDILPFHTNGMQFKAFDEEGNVLLHKTYYSIGGGFIINEEHAGKEEATAVEIPHPFNNTNELLEQCKQHDLTIAQVILANECALRSEEEVKAYLLKIYQTMQDCIERGIHKDGILPGGLNVKRRAAKLHKALAAKGKPRSHEFTDSMSWLNLYAIAVNEENAAGGRIVTAPTNGAAGIIPAVLSYYHHFYPNATNDKIIEFLLTAGAIAILFKKNASISGAEVGCQGEVGVACSMAAAGFAAVLGGTLAQIEDAAEIGIEHHLGMTCDPIGGLVQIPCIERNAMGAVKAVNAAQLALAGDGDCHVPLDKAIITMKQTGEDMHHIYKETSLGGLAANTPEC